MTFFGIDPTRAGQLLISTVLMICLDFVLARSLDCLLSIFLVLFSGWNVLLVLNDLFGRCQLAVEAVVPFRFISFFGPLCAQAVTMRIVQRYIRESAPDQVKNGCCCRGNLKGRPV